MNVVPVAAVDNDSNACWRLPILMSPGNIVPAVRVVTGVNVPMLALLNLELPDDEFLAIMYNVYGTVFVNPVT